MNNFTQLYQDSIAYQQAKRQKKIYSSKIESFIEGKADQMQATKLSREQLMERIKEAKYRIKGKEELVGQKRLELAHKVGSTEVIKRFAKEKTDLIKH